MTRDEAARVLEEKVEVWEGVLKHMLPAGDYSELKQIEDYETALRMGAAALRGPEWVRTEDRLPEGDEHDEILGLYKGTDYLLYDIVQIGWLRLHPEMYVYWIHLPQKPEVEE